MDANEDAFQLAVERVRSGAISDLSDNDKLRLYGLYSVALKGLPTGPAPSALNFREAAKHSAWVDAAKFSPEQARAEYVKLTERLANVNVSKNTSNSGSFEKQAPTGFQIGGTAAPKLDLCHWANIGDVASVQYCLRRESPNYRDEDGLTPLMRAADRGHLNVVDILLDANADMGLKDEDGNTALHYAAICGHADIAGVLVLAGASLEVKDNDGTSPIELAADDETKTIMTTAKAGTWIRPFRPATVRMRQRFGFVALFAFLMLVFSVVIAKWRGK